MKEFWKKPSFFVSTALYTVVDLYDQVTLSVVVGALSALTTKPHNVIIRKGDDVYMECSSNFPNFNAIAWTHDAYSASRIPCTTTDSARYTVVQPPVPGQNCYLTASGNAIIGNQGVYVCSDGSGIVAEAVAVLIGTACSCELPTFVVIILTTRLCSYEHGVCPMHFDSLQYMSV